MHACECRPPDASMTLAADPDTKSVTTLSMTLSRRGMRLADTVFLTMPVALLQVWLGMRCSRPGEHCHIILGHHNFNILMLVSIIASIIGAQMQSTAPVCVRSVYPRAAMHCQAEGAVHCMPYAPLNCNHSMQLVTRAGGDGAAGDVKAPQWPCPHIAWAKLTIMMAASPAVPVCRRRRDAGVCVAGLERLPVRAEPLAAAGAGQ